MAHNAVYDFIGYPSRAKNPKNSMGGAEPAVQSGPEPVSWTPKGSRQTARKIGSINRKLESRLGEIQRLGTQPIRGKITSSGLHPIQSTPIQSDSTHSNPMHWNRTQSNPAASNLMNATRLSSNPTHGIDSMPGHWMVRRSIHLLECKPRRLNT